MARVRSRTSDRISRRGQSDSVDHPSGQRFGPGQRIVEAASGGVEEREVEADVVADEHRVVTELEE